MKRVLTLCCYRHLGAHVSIGEKLDQNNFGFVIQSEREKAVSYSAADYHTGVITLKESLVIFWEEALIWRKKSADQGESELTAVRVSR